MNDDAAGAVIDVVAHDDALVAIDKAAGLPSVPGRKPELADCAWSRVQQRWPDALVVHRLDMATSGLLLFARGAAVQTMLSRAFAAREVRKTYLALVHGHVAGDDGAIDLPLAADWPRRPRQVVDHDRGKPSLTRWHVIARSAVARSAVAPHTLLRLEPLTGRSHQLRVHLAAIGHPIIGDTLYGGATGLGTGARSLVRADPSIRTEFVPCPEVSKGQDRIRPAVVSKSLAASGAAAARMRLHALSIELAHPITGQHMVLRTKEPSWTSDAT